MDCIYCGIRKQMALQEDALDSNFLYEYTVCLYENYMAKLFHSICAMYDLESQSRVKITMSVTMSVVVHTCGVLYGIIYTAYYRYMGV